MRFKFISSFIVIVLLLLHGKSYGQISIHENKVEIQKLFKLIEQQSQITFLYDSQDVSGIPLITLKITNGSLPNVLSQVFKGLPLTYKIIAKTVLVKKNPRTTEKKEQANPTKIAGIYIRGMVMDEHHIPLQNVTIKEPRLSTSVLSKANGEFALQGGNSGVIVLSAPGFSEKVVEYVDTAFLNITLKNNFFKSIDLAEVKIESSNVLANPTKFIDLENRNYMNLAQILQGTIPGLSLQVVNTSTKTVTSIDHYVQFLNGQPYQAFMRSTVEDFLNIVGKVRGQQIIDLLLKGSNVPRSISDRYHLNTTTTISNTLVPEIRGASNFGNNVSNMLVVIDGFPQEGFPANYPMTNVESIEVIKDPKELIKWGPRAAGGAILIKSKTAKAGNLKFNYMSNFYFSPAPKFDREQLKLANTTTYLNYLQDLDAIANNTFGNSAFGLSPARELLAQKRSGQISASQFDSKWDSLSRMDNQEQLSLLRQDAFNQNHSLTVSGGNKAYKFTAIGNYTDGRTNDIRSKNSNLSLSLNNNFDLLKNKLHIRWLINFSDIRNRAGYSFSPTSINLDPYQLLLDAQGNYAYDNTRLSTSANQLIQSRGYKNYGVNILEDARLNSSTSNIISKQSNFNMNWNLLPGLQWSSSFIYTQRKGSTKTLFGAESSFARQLVDNYGQLTTNGVNFYVPYGDIFRQNKTDYDDANLRSGLNYAKQVGKHVLQLGLGVGGASITRSTPSYNTLYGYNERTGTSTPVFLPTNPSVQSTIRNFYTLFPGTSSTSFPFSLTQNTTGDTTVVRNLNANASMRYAFSDRINASALYTNVLNPLYGQSETYSTLSSYNAEVTGLAVKNWGHFLQDVLLSVGTSSIKMPDIPGRYTNTRYLQNYWNNYTIIVNGAIPTQQQGQSSRLLYQKLILAFADSAVVVNGAYNRQTIHGNLNAAASANAIENITTVSKYFSGGIDMFLRKKLLNVHFNYAKSPEGNDQFNGSLDYNISRETYFRSNKISDLSFNMILQQISPYQGLGVMQSTNVATNGSYSQAISSDFGLLPAQSKLFEAHARIGFTENKYNMDLRYYNQTSSGLNNNLSVLTDPSTGLSNQISFSSITNRGVEFFFNTVIVKTSSFNYNVTLNGARNSNIANNVPLTNFTASSDYTLALREGNDVSNIWAPRWAGLNSSGDPQIYNSNNNITSVLDSATIVSAMVKQGVTKSPWTGGFIQEVRLHNFFARVALTFNFGHVMRYYRPYPGSNLENSSLLAERWRKPGDELITDIPAINTLGANTYREFVSRYSSNSILPADNIRLSEVMLGFYVPNEKLKKFGLSGMTMTFQVQNLTYWARNKYHIDPATVSLDGRIGLPLPRIYSCNINVNF
ncbi:hypothetical protein ASU31_00595 [Pedobacter ginsenosidimutans]|uniref:Secretin/TonB short N-terminal domain-containing protein n=1 Tax=Pedobacter ginsenosidimutans TaxID=687842 RepID=A0A0T5VXA7_9SPHI|nr:SusC/RagA family TonB-linked outer membrane protein [Pedobacter ginsenosidimutans]KRT17829.1 hypothetical protein ASU31_00595 [Pedobacter ginsenosidimutans]